MQRAETIHSRVTQALAGDQQAFAQLVHDCERTLYAAAMAILHNEQDALDAVQDAILNGWRKLDTLKQRAYFTTWMTRIVVRTAINHARKRQPTAPLYELPAPDAAREEIIDVRRAMDGLDEKTRLCATLYYYEGFSIDQIARVVGIRSGTVKSRLFRARQQLRVALEGPEHDA